MNLMGHATVALSQGPAFFHAGTDLLRSKSLDRNSYNSGDWFNRIDWSAEESTFGSGLPPKGDNESKWPFATTALTEVDPPTAEDLQSATARFQELLAVRSASPLFRLGTADLIQERVSFPAESIDGLIVMRLSDRVGRDVDPNLEDVVVVFNATSQQQVAAAPGNGRWDLHPIQKSSVDRDVRSAGWSSGKLTVPARTTAVFVQR
jgi:pullulanase/glycogen debranching enzyme